MHCHSVRKLSVVVQRVEYAVEHIKRRRDPFAVRGFFGDFRVKPPMQSQRYQSMDRKGWAQIAQAQPQAEVHGSFHGGVDLRVIRTPVPCVRRSQKVDFRVHPLDLMMCSS